MPSLVSLLEDTMLDTIRVPAATAIAMMCCSDGPCQDALRLSNGIGPLVRMADSVDSRVARVAKLAIDCACEANSPNHAATMRALRIERIASNGGFGRASALLVGLQAAPLPFPPFPTRSPPPPEQPRCHCSPHLEMNAQAKASTFLGEETYKTYSPPRDKSPNRYR